RNKFLSIHDRKPYMLDINRDTEGEVFERLGRTMSVEQLAYHMITSSSNFATNLLVDVVGVPVIQTALDELKIEGIKVLRGREDRGGRRVARHLRVPGGNERWLRSSRNPASRSSTRSTWTPSCARCSGPASWSRASAASTTTCPAISTRSPPTRRPGRSASRRTSASTSSSSWT